MTTLDVADEASIASWAGRGAGPAVRCVLYKSFSPIAPVSTLDRVSFQLTDELFLYGTTLFLVRANGGAVDVVINNAGTTARADTISGSWKT